MRYYRFLEEIEKRDHIFMFYNEILGKNETFVLIEKSVLGLSISVKVLIKQFVSKTIDTIHFREIFGY